MRTIRNERTSLEIYIDELRNKNCNALNTAEELDLLEKASNGDKKAQEKIVKANLRFVISVAKKYSKSGAELDDLIQVGNIALFESFNSFDFESFKKSGCHRFISYAGRRIAQQMALEAKNICPVTITECKYKELRRLQMAIAEIENLDDSYDAIEIAAKQVNMRSDKARELLNVTNSPSSIDYVSDEGAKPLSERLSDKRHRFVDEEIIMKISSEELVERMEELSELEEEVLTMAYGLDGEKPLNYPSIGKKLGYTREGIRVVHNRAINKLRDWMGFAA